MKRRNLLKILPVVLLSPSWSRGATLGSDDRLGLSTGKPREVRAWLVEEFIDRTDHTTWGFDGIFESEKKALEACVIESQSVRPVILYKESSDENRNGPLALKAGTFDTWIVGEMILNKVGNNFTGSFVGAYDCEEAAIRACTNAYRFVAPSVLNETFAGDDMMRVWPGMWYPLWQDNPHSIAHRPGFIDALEFVESNDGKFTLENFIRDHKAAGGQLWEDMRSASLARINDQGKIIISRKGKKLLEWVYWNSPLKSVRGPAF